MRLSEYTCTLDFSLPTWRSSAVPISSCARNRVIILITLLRRTPPGSTLMRGRKKERERERRRRTALVCVDERVHSLPPNLLARSICAPYKLGRCVWYPLTPWQRFAVGKAWMETVCWHVINASSCVIIMWECHAPKAVQLLVVYISARCFTSTRSQESWIPVGACIFSLCLWDSSCSVLYSVSITVCVCVCVYTVHTRIGGARLEGCVSCRLTGEGAVWILFGIWLAGWLPGGWLLARGG